MDNAALRRQIASLLDWKDAHVTFDHAVSGIPHDLRGRQPAGLPYSPWQLLEHLRLAQRDILEFCTSPGYEEPVWPDDYWPAGPAPGDGEWERSMESFRADREALKQLAFDVDLFESIPHGTGQTYLRELLLVADHNAYHIGELIVVRRLLGNWT